MGPSAHRSVRLVEQRDRDRAVGGAQAAHGDFDSADGLGSENGGRREQRRGGGAPQAGSCYWVGASHAHPFVGRRRMDSEPSDFSSEAMSDANSMAAEVLEISAAGFASAADAHLQRARPDFARGGSTALARLFPPARARACGGRARRRSAAVRAARRVAAPRCSRPLRRRQWRRAAAAQPRRGAARGSTGRAARQHRRRARRGARNARKPLEPEPSALRADDAFGRLALEYITACLDGDTAGAAAAVLAAADGGVAPQDLYCRVLMPAQKEVGRLWHRGDLNVAEERLVSETTRRVMAQLAARFQPAHPTGPKVLAAGVAGNAHDLGLRAATDLFALAGWRCLYLGANVPTTDIAALAEAHGVDIVLLAATLETQLGATAEAVAEVKRRAPASRTLLGGIELDDDSAALRGIGADAHCRRLDDVVGRRELLRAKSR